MARIDYPDPAALSERAAKTLDAMPPMNIFRMLAHADQTFPRLMAFTGSLWNETELPPRRRELAILRVAQLTGARYEWDQHVAIARACGVTDDEIAAIEAGEVGDAFEVGDRALLELTAAIVTGPRADDEVFQAAARALSPRELVELHLVAGAYVLLARLMTNLEVDLDKPHAAALLAREPPAK